jgi:hypothetical protein
MSDSDNLRVRIVKLPALLAEAMLYHGLSANDPSIASVLAQSETVLIKGASPSQYPPPEFIPDTTKLSQQARDDVSMSSNAYVNLRYVNLELRESLWRGILFVINRQDRRYVQKKEGGGAP